MYKRSLRVSADQDQATQAHVTAPRADPAHCTSHEPTSEGSSQCTAQPRSKRIQPTNTNHWLHSLALQANLKKSIHISLIEIQNPSESQQCCSGLRSPHLAHSRIQILPGKCNPGKPTVRRNTQPKPQCKNHAAP